MIAGAPLIVLLYLLFLLSGAAALVYEVVWVRSLALVFGGSHLAITTVLAVFMGGLALGGLLVGRVVERSRRPLRLYGWLEIGIAASAAGFALLVEIFPAIYVPLARWDETNRVWLSVLRVAFAACAMIVPTTLMGGTLPVLTRLVASRPRHLGRHLAMLYGFNTLGAVLGTLGSGFLLLPALGVKRSLGVAVATNLAIGLLALALPARLLGATESSASPAPAGAGRERAAMPELPARLVLWGVGISGFCALGFEVLWTRVLSLVVGTSVYSFAIMLVAFLTGIAFGSQTQALLPRLIRGWETGWRPPVAVFAAAQLAIGAAALGTTYALRSLPRHAASLQQLLSGGGTEFAARQGASFLLAFAFMAVPAFFMGLAFPVAGIVHARRRGTVGEAVGRTLAFNTIGAILGASASGFLLVFVFGVERSLQMLVVVNLGLGLVVLASTLGERVRRPGAGVAALLTAAALALLAAAPDWAHLWDRKFFAIYRNNQRTAFSTDARVRDALENTDVLYYHEGINETISVIRPKRAAQAFVVNGRVEASTHIEDIQCQRTLGHLPMLAHPNPRRVFVLGLGTGMTLGATSIHPEVEQITLAELELGVLEAARTYGKWNHEVLDSPKLRIVHDDGRNFLRTTRETFDVITADPIHPWSGGASYLYTAEYFRTAAARLAPGGVMCQWLPIYELTVEDVRSVVRTFAESFRYTAIWLTYYDAEILASNEPLDLDEARLARRFADRRIADDLAAVEMGSARDFLAYFVMGDAGVRAFAAGGVLNTDDNLWLEFSAPRSQGVAELPGEIVSAVAAFRESPLDYGKALAHPDAEAERRAYWARLAPAAAIHDRAHALGLWNRFSSPEFETLFTQLRTDYPDYAPGRFLERRYERAVSRKPTAIASQRFAALDAGGPVEIEIVAVVVGVGEGRAAVDFVDNARREVYAERYLETDPDDLAGAVESFALEVLEGLRIEYVQARADSGAGLPERAALASRLRRAAARLAAED